MAVYTDVSDEDVDDFLAQYALGEALSCVGIAEGIENSNFALTTTQGPFILTLYEKRVREEDLPYFLGLMEHLAGIGIPCPTPLPGRDGRALRRLNGRAAALFTFLPGMWPRRIQPDHCAEVGESLARLHLAGAGFAEARINDLSVADWRPILEAAGEAVDDLRPGLYAEVQQSLDELEADWPKALPIGAIHADLFPDNVFFRSGHVSGIIDFYFACTDAFAYDVAVCLNAWCFERDLSFNATKARRLLAGYERVREFSEAERQALPVLSRGAAMRFLVTRLFDWFHTPDDALVTPKDPLEYWQRLRFHAAVDGPGAYGLD